MFNTITIDVNGFKDSCPKVRYSSYEKELEKNNSSGWLDTLLKLGGRVTYDKNEIDDLPMIPDDYKGFVDISYYDGFLPAFNEVHTDVDKSLLSKKDRDIHELKYGWLDVFGMKANLSISDIVNFRSQKSLKVVYSFLPYLCELAFRNNCYTLKLDKKMTDNVLDNINSILEIDKNELKNLIVVTLKKYCLYKENGKPYEIIREVKIKNKTLYVCLDENQRINESTKLYIR